MLNETNANRSFGGMPYLRAFCAFEGEENGNGGGQNNGGQQNGNGGQGNGQNGNGSGGNNGGQTSLDAANSEAARRRHENAELQTQLQTVQAELEEFKKKERTDLENAQAERDREKTAREASESEASSLRIQNAFLSNNKHDWHNPADALKMADLSGVTIKDGKVEGLEAALDKLAKDSAYLLKTKPDENNGGIGQQQNGGNGQQQNPTAPGGTPAGGQGGEKYSREVLAKKYPALRGLSD